MSHFIDKFTKSIKGRTVKQFPSFSTSQLFADNLKVSYFAPLSVICLVGLCVNKFPGFKTSSSTISYFIFPVVFFAQIVFCVFYLLSAMFYWVNQCGIQVVNMTIRLLSFLPFYLKIKKSKKTSKINVANKTTGVVSGKILNESGSTLPSTGGVGTVIFYTLGSLLVIGCGIVLISRKRTNN